MLGFGTLWDRFGYLQDPAAGTASQAPDTHFSGALAIAAFERGGGASYRGAKVPVENDTTRYRAPQTCIGGTWVRVLHLFGMFTARVQAFQLQPQLQYVVRESHQKKNEYQIEQVDPSHSNIRDVAAVE